MNSTHAVIDRLSLQTIYSGSYEDCVVYASLDSSRDIINDQGRMATWVRHSASPCVGCGERAAVTVMKYCNGCKPLALIKRSP